MLSLPPPVRILLCREPCDMRRSFDALARMVEQFVGGDPLSGHLFVFRSRRGDRLKILCWGGDGYWIYYKRLEKGAFEFPPAAGTAPVSLAASDLALILDGVALSSVRRHPRYRRTA